MAHYLICYDIANPKRLGRVHRRVVRHALFLQYSVYYLQGDKPDLQTALNDIKDVIDPMEDDVRAYTIAPLSEAFQLGVPWFPDEVVLL